MTNDFAHRTIILLTLFSQFLTNVRCPVPNYSKTKGLSTVKFNVFQLFPVSGTALQYNTCKHKPYLHGRLALYVFPFDRLQVLLTITIMWIVCALLTVYDYFPVGHPARTDVKIRILEDSSWFRVPYPGKDITTARDMSAWTNS